MKPDKIIHSRPNISQQDKKRVLETLETGFVGQGEQVEKVNSFFSSLFNKKTSFFVNSGTAAFFLALKTLGIKKDNEVILPNYLCGSIYAQVKNLEAIPVVIDTIADSFFVSPEIILKAITPKTKAILINHPFGHFEPAVLELRKTGITIIEDVTHSLFAQDGNVIAGSIADVTIASFGSTKFITSGTGGIVSLSEKSIANKIEKLLDYDYSIFPASEGEERFNYKLGDLNAALLLGQLKQIDTIIKKRHLLAQKYYLDLKVPVYPATFNEKSVYFRFFIQVKKNKGNIIQKKLERNNIDSVIGGGRLINKTFSLQQAYPNSEEIWSELISIPMYPSLKPMEINRILEVLNTIK